MILKVICSYKSLELWLFGDTRNLEYKRINTLLRRLKHEAELAGLKFSIYTTKSALLCLQYRLKRAKKDKIRAKLNKKRYAELKSFTPIHVSTDHRNNAIELGSILDLNWESSILLACANGLRIPLVIQLDSELLHKNSPISYGGVSVITPKFMLAKFKANDALQGKLYMRKIRDWIDNKQRKIASCIDVRVLMEFKRNNDFANSFLKNKPELLLPSGRSVEWLLRQVLLTEASVKELYLLEEIIEYCKLKQKRLMLICDKKNVLKKLQDELSVDIESLTVLHLKNTQYLSEKNLSEIKFADPEIILLSLNHPTQERWIVNNRHKLGTTVVAVADAFQLYSKCMLSAPSCMKEINCEWVYHLISDPRGASLPYATSIPSFILEHPSFILDNPSFKDKITFPVIKAITNCSNAIVERVRREPKEHQNDNVNRLLEHIGDSVL